MNRLHLASLLFATGAAAAGPLAAAGGQAAAGLKVQAPRVSEPAAGSRFAAGARGVAVFDLSGVALDGIDEMELVLSLDGGRTFPHCVSRDLSPGASRAVWTAPALPAKSAVLAVRTGGRGETERVVAVSAPFEIVAPEPEAPLPAGGALGSREPAVGPLSGPATDLERVPVPTPCRGAVSLVTPPRAAVPGPEPQAPVSSRPLFLPRRE